MEKGAVTIIRRREMVAEEGSRAVPCFVDGCKLCKQAANYSLLYPSPSLDIRLGGGPCAQQMTYSRIGREPRCDASTLLTFFFPGVRRRVFGPVVALQSPLEEGRKAGQLLHSPSLHLGHPTGWHLLTRPGGQRRRGVVSWGSVDTGDEGSDWLARGGRE
jgi:hypothetical protein